MRSSGWARIFCTATIWSAYACCICAQKRERDCPFCRGIIMEDHLWVEAEYTTLRGLRTTSSTAVTNGTDCTDGFYNLQEARCSRRFNFPLAGSRKWQRLGYKIPCNRRVLTTYRSATACRMPFSRLRASSLIYSYPILALLRRMNAIPCSRCDVKWTRGAHHTREVQSKRLTISAGKPMSRCPSRNVEAHPVT